MDVPDPLITLRQSVALSLKPLLTTSSDSASPTVDLPHATHIHFLNLHGKNLTYPLDTVTRFSSNDTPVDLRSIYFAWLNSDASGPDYIASTQRINEELGGKATLKNLLFAERLDLNGWLGGGQDDSEYITPLAAAEGAAAAAEGGIKAPKQFDARLQEIYKGERRIQDRYTVLHGIKPTDFSHVRKIAGQMLYSMKHGGSAGKPSSSSQPSAASARPPPGGSSVTLPHNTRRTRRQDPIILLSPSASALLRISNAKHFLEDGVYAPPSSSDAEPMTVVSRMMPSINPNGPTRFLLTETSDFPKSEDWARLVAVFTTGQMWQFKGYKWSQPAELFSKAMGVYVGWSGDQVPDTVKGWGRAVKAVGVEKWSGGNGAAGGQAVGRWKDREVVESIWVAIEASMRAKGWNRELGLVPNNK